MLNICPECGTELPGSARFCLNCGAALDKGAPPEPAAPKQPRVRRERVRVKPDTTAPVVPAQAPVLSPPSSASDEIEDGPWVKTTEEIFPIAWIAMTCAVAYIGIYFAVEALPGRNLLPGPGWFG
jgi:hypothetical protein